jgi:hypothetical protein
MSRLPKGFRQEAARCIEKLQQRGPVSVLMFTPEKAWDALIVMSELWLCTVVRKAETARSLHRPALLLPQLSLTGSSLQVCGTSG